MLIQVPKQSLHSAKNKIKYIIYLKANLELGKQLAQVLEGCQNPVLLLMRYFPPYQKFTYRQNLQNQNIEKLQQVISKTINENTAMTKKGIQHEICFSISPGINGLLDVARQVL